MKPGRELDRLVAEKVMGWRTCPNVFPGGVGWDTGEERLRNWRSWSPSTNIAHAWEVVEKVTAITGPRVDGVPSATRFMQQWYTLDLWASSAQEAAHAICLTALTAVGVEITEETT